MVRVKLELFHNKELATGLFITSLLSQGMRSRPNSRTKLIHIERSSSQVGLWKYQRRKKDIYLAIRINVLMKEYYYKYYV